MIRSVAGDLWAVGSAAGLIALAGLIGHRLGRSLHTLPLPPEERLARWLFKIGAGLGLLAYLPMALGAAGLLTPAIVRAALVLLLLFALLLDGLSNRQNPPSKNDKVENRKSPLPSWAWAIAAVAAVFLGSAFLSCLTPMVDYDGLAYHVGAPKRWLELGAMRFLPTHLHTQWPMGSEMLYTLLLPVAGDAACKPFVALLTALTACAVYALGARLASRPVGVTAAALFVLRAGAPSINTTSVEMALTFFLVLSALALSFWGRAEEGRERRGWFAWAAVFAGFACCVKLSGLLPTAILAAVVLVMPRPGESKPAARIGDAALFLTIAITCALPWYARAWVHTGSPVYPFAYCLFGGAFWSHEAGAVLAAYFRSFDLPGEDLAARHAFVVRHLWKLLALTLVGAALPGPRWVRGCAFGGGLFAMIQVTLSDNARFLLPAAPFGALVIAWWLVHGATRWPLLGWAAAAGLAALFAPTAVREGGPSLPVALGLSSRDAFVRRYVNNRDAFLWANAHLPANARILYGPDNRTYFLQREVFWSSAVFQRHILYDHPQSFAQSLRRFGITHLILNRDMYAKDSAFAFESRMGWREDERRRLEAAAAQSTRLWEGEGVAVYRLSDNPSGLR